MIQKLDQPNAKFESFFRDIKKKYLKLKEILI